MARGPFFSIKPNHSTFKFNSSLQASKQARKKSSECVFRLMADKISPEAVEILKRLEEIKNKIQELIRPLRFQVTYQELYRLRNEQVITDTEFQLLTNPLYDPFE